MKFTNQLRSQAWRRMSIVRTCPPVSVLQAGGEQVEQHLRSCAVCREVLRHQSTLKNAGALLAKIPLPQHTSQPVKAGDIRRVRPCGFARDWFDASGCYHNPPLVLVLDNPDINGFVRVAQVFNEAELCDTGDIPLNDGVDEYAESWNIYGLPVSGLANKTFRRSPLADIQKVIEAADLKFPKLDRTTPLYHFRLCEIETGAYFSLGLNETALTDLEKNISRTEGQLFRTIVLEDILESVMSKWENHAKQVPLAAASEAVGEDNSADDIFPLHVLAVIQSGGVVKDPINIKSTVNLYKLSSGCLCEVNIPIHPSWSLLKAKAEYKGQIAEDIRWDESQADTLVITVKFPINFSNSNDLRIVLVMEEKSK